MTDTTTPLTSQDVYDALAELKKGRSRSRAHIAIRGILYRYGNGVKRLDQLDPKYYAAVIAAVTIPTVPTAADIYGTVTDVQPVTNTRNNVAAPTRKRDVVEEAPQRIKSPLTLDLERRLAERAGKPRSRPNYVVNVGNPAQPGDEDAPRQYSNDGVKVS